MLSKEGRGAGGLKAKVFQDVPIQLVLLVHYKHQVGRFAGVFSRQQVVISLDIWRFPLSLRSLGKEDRPRLVRLDTPAGLARPGMPRPAIAPLLPPADGISLPFRVTGTTPSSVSRTRFRAVVRVRLMLLQMSGSIPFR